MRSSVQFPSSYIKHNMHINTRRKRILPGKKTFNVLGKFFDPHFIFSQTPVDPWAWLKTVFILKLVLWALVRPTVVKPVTLLHLPAYLALPSGSLLKLVSKFSMANLYFPLCVSWNEQTKNNNRTWSCHLQSSFHMSRASLLSYVCVSLPGTAFHETTASFN